MVSNLTVLEGIFETKLKDWFFFEIFFYRISFKIEGELNKFLMDFSFKCGSESEKKVK